MAELRELVLSRECGLCQVCQARGSIAVATMGDHTKPKAEGAAMTMTTSVRSAGYATTPRRSAKQRGGGGQESLNEVSR